MYPCAVESINAMKEDDHLNDDRRSGELRRADDRAVHSIREDRRLIFDVIKWVAALIVAVVGIYVMSERRAERSDISSAYLDRKTEEMKLLFEKQGTQINSRLDVLQQSVQNIAAANSGMQQQIKGQDDKISEIKNEIQALREHDSMQERMLAELRASRK